MKYQAYKLLRANGEWESIRVPMMFDATDVARHAQHSVITMFVPKGQCIYFNDGKAVGPYWTVWSRAKTSWVGRFEDVERVPWSELYRLEDAENPLQPVA